MRKEKAVKKGVGVFSFERANLWNIIIRKTSHWLSYDKFSRKGAKSQRLRIDKFSRKGAKSQRLRIDKFSRKGAIPIAIGIRIQN